MNLQEKILRSYEVGLVCCIHTLEPFSVTSINQNIILEFDLSKIQPPDFPLFLFAKIFRIEEKNIDITLNDVSIYLKNSFKQGQISRKILIFRNLDVWQATSFGSKMIAGLRTLLDLNKESLFSVITYSSKENLLAEYDNVKLPFFKFGMIVYK